MLKISSLRHRTITQVLLIVFMAGNAMAMPQSQAPLESSASASGSSVVGNVGYSNQAKFELPVSFLYLSVNRQPVSTSDVASGGYVATFDRGLNYPSIDYDVRTAGISSSFGLWLRYGLGIGVKDGKLAHSSFAVSSGAESSSLFMGALRFGPALQWERWGWLRPQLGIRALAEGYRVSTSIAGSESQGYGFDAEPFAGFVIAPASWTKLSAFFEVRRSLHLAAKNQAMGDGTGLAGGLGVSF